MQASESWECSKHRKRIAASESQPATRPPNKQNPAAALGAVRHLRSRVAAGAGTPGAPHASAVVGRGPPLMGEDP